MAFPRPRSVFERLPAYRAGKPAYSDAYKLSSNENPFPPLPSVLERASTELGRMNRYPDAGMAALYRSLSARLGVEEDQLAGGTGSVGVLFTLLAAFCEAGDEVVYPWRSFEAYPIAVDLAGATGVPIALRDDASHDLDAMADAITEATRVVLVCSPNNPTGPVVTRDELDAFLARVPSDVLVVIDEAYAEFVRHPAAVRGLDALAGRDNLVVLRTFSKAYGLAGLRIGFLVGPPAIASVVRTATAPFAVTDIAIAAAVASLEAVDELEQRLEAIVAEREDVMTALRADGWDVPDTHANFVWLPLGADSLDFAAHCAPVSVRAFDGEGVRVTIGDPEINAEFLTAAARWRAAR
ncbi:aminotransferase class I/II-fold pyridoxal phosphate-dependent enzyme [Aeromicrobium phragmitis]|uniref:Aromatic amino acid aminotransferase n=1 Tax=Aeromicrobium phragmitis TaxID=2478914 RepID=A0A3L8PSB8_9ACTN|nr:histidinol-phosphate transaminase [Aeromicrobium phragmitis]RLV57553.1 aminotransferase class I/II-fold pyridoxal phosphate-dependent enzyme [Aeromicrobium phragmitis]